MLKSIISQSSVHCSKIILLTHQGVEWNIVWKGCFDRTICHGKSQTDHCQSPTDRVVTKGLKADADCDVKDASNHQLQIVPREGLLRIRCALKWYSLRTAGQVIPKRVLYLGSFSSLTYISLLFQKKSSLAHCPSGGYWIWSIRSIHFHSDALSILLSSNKAQNYT